MANSPASKQSAVNAEARKGASSQPVATMSVIVPAVAWLIPGAGHLIQKRWIRGVLLMASIVSMFVLGLLMQGRVYRPSGGDILDILGFVGDGAVELVAFRDQLSIPSYPAPNAPHAASRGERMSRDRRPECSQGIQNLSTLQSLRTTAVAEC